MLREKKDLVTTFCLNVHFQLSTTCVYNFFVVRKLLSCLLLSFILFFLSHEQFLLYSYSRLYILYIDDFKCFCSKSRVSVFPPFKIRFIHTRCQVEARENSNSHACLHFPTPRSVILLYLRTARVLFACWVMRSCRLMNFLSPFVFFLVFPSLFFEFL